MQSIPESWTGHINREVDRYVAALFERDGNRYRCGDTNRVITHDEFAQIRQEIIANATVDSQSLAYQMLLQSGHNPHTSAPCPTCNAAVRLAWGASATRRLLGLPASHELM
jgi:hypothetical protein